MLENVIFSLNATLPVFLTMVVGFVIKKLGLITEKGTDIVNGLVFKIFLPALLFIDVATQDFKSMWDGTFVLFCAVATIISIVIAIGLSYLNKDKTDRGEFVQASYRSAAATLGIAFMTNIYDNVVMVALMLIGAVIVYNVAAVLILSITVPDNKRQGTKGQRAKAVFANVIKNPIIISVLLGLVWSYFSIPQPEIIFKTISYLGDVASPLALIGLGAAFEISGVREKKLPIIMALFNKLILFCAIFIPVGIYLGFRDEKLVAALIMLGSATTSSAFIMAKNMGHKGIISSGAVMIGTFLSSFTLSFWLFVLRTMGYI